MYWCCFFFMWKKVFQIIEPSFIVLASLASIIGLVIIFIKTEWAVIVSLVFFCLVLLCFLIALLRVLNKFIERHSGEPYKKKSSFIKYETADGVNIIFETYRLIQSKTLVLTEFPYHFKWTGKHQPIVTSKLQRVEQVISNSNNSYDEAVLKFATPLLYNETGVVHFYTKLNDVEGISQPHVEVKVDAPIDIIHFRIVLKHKPNSYLENAILKRREIASQISSDFENIESLPFDGSTKCYEYHLLNPQIGYFYKIEWVK